MAPDEKATFAEAMRAAWALKGRELTAPMLQLCWGVLDRFELADVTRALGVHASSGNRFPPQPGEIAELIEGSPDDAASRAWARVLTAVQTLGAYSSLVFDDALIHATVAEMGGWPALCRMTVEETPFRQAEFVKRYRGYRQQRQIPPYPPALLGLEAQDPRSGEVKPEVLGDREMCALVYRGGAENHAQQRLTNVADLAQGLLPKKSEGDIQKVRRD